MTSYLALTAFALLVVYLTVRFGTTQLSPEAQDEHERLTKAVDDKVTEASAPKRKRGRPRKDS